MNVTFYTFSKKENSTKQPGGGSGYNVALKEPSSVLAPVIRLIWTGAGSPVHFNYAYIPSYSRYYFVRNWTYAERQWQAELVVDPLASWKTYIGAASKYIVRANRLLSEDEYVLDGMYPVTFDQTIETTSITSPFASNLSSGCYVFGLIASDSTTNIGGISYFALSGSEAKKLTNALYQQAVNIFNPGGTSISDVGKALATFGENLVKGLLNPMQFVVSAMWIPWQIGGTPEAIKLGDFPTGAYGIPIAIPAAPLTSLEISIPLIVVDRTYQRIEPYVYYSLEFQPFGIIPLSAIDLLKYTAITCAITLDYVSGLCILRVYPKDNPDKCLATRTAQVGVQLAVTGSSANNAGGLMNIAGAVAGVAAENYIGAAGSILNAANDFVPQARSSGTSGGFAGLAAYTNITLVRRQSRGPGVDPQEHGYPVMDHAQINTFTGYVMCDDGDIDAPATMQELAQIKSYLEGGFFYE